MPEAARCPKCRWGRLTYPPEIEAGRCVGCMGNRVNTEPMWPYRTVYRSGMNEYGQEGVIDDD